MHKTNQTIVDGIFPFAGEHFLLASAEEVSVAFLPCYTQESILILPHLLETSILCIKTT